MNTIARLENVSQHFGATTALKDITLSIPARCMVGLIGPDGVGKSSLLSLISGTALGGMFDQEIKSALTSAVQAIWGEARHSLPPSVAGPVDRLLDRVALHQGSLSHLGSLRG